jgi:hypothetical protein
MATRSPSGAAAKKSATKKTTKRSAPRSTDDSSEDGSSQESAPRRGSAPRASAPKRATASQAAASAARQLLELTGREAEGVTGLERTDDGWTVKVEVVEVRRIPDTTDVLALYDVEVDADGDLLGYRRVRRYTRGVPGED